MRPPKSCCEAWQTCYWFTWARRCKPLKKAAKQIRRAAEGIAHEGRMMQLEMFKIEQCCNEPRYNSWEEQAACMQGRELFKSCDDIEVLSRIITTRSSC